MNIETLCCISRDNCNLRTTIEAQSNEIGRLLEQKRVLQEQYENLLMTISSSNVQQILLNNGSSNL